MHLLPRTAFTLRRPALVRAFTHSSPVCNDKPPALDHSASSKLFADAAREEAEEAARPRRPVQVPHEEHENWTGDESVRDAVLRMLVDKYKPLRGDFRSADEKLRRAPPVVHSDADAREEGLHDGEPLSVLLSGSSTQPVTASPPLSEPGALADVPLLPALPGHRPWHTTFKAPAHAAAHVRAGQFPPPARRPAALPEDERERKKVLDGRRRAARAGRLTHAREASLDYRLGMKAAAQAQTRAAPVSMKGWTSLVEDRIERARREGRFDKIAGRGQPLARHHEEHNPFIAREEFLMNRIVQRQGAAPPWVEAQGELDTALDSFRTILLASWTRRALRNITLETPHGQLRALSASMSIERAQALRDAAWEAHERGYHEHALAEVNALMRKYNGLAPTAVRRGYYARAPELERVYAEAGAAIVRGLEERVRAGADGAQLRGRGVADEEAGLDGGGGADVSPVRMWDVVRAWARRAFGREASGR